MVVVVVVASISGPEGAPNMKKQLSKQVFKKKVLKNNGIDPIKQAKELKTFKDEFGNE